MALKLPPFFIIISFLVCVSYINRHWAADIVSYLVITTSLHVVINKMWLMKMCLHKVYIMSKGTTRRHIELL